MSYRFAVLLLTAPLLAGCVTTGEGSVTGGECKIFEAPRYAVKGARPYDQDWIDSQIEGGVGGCKWARPAPRPTELDAPLTKRAAPKAKAAPKKKGSWIWRMRPSGVWPTKVVVPAPEQPVPVTPISDPAPAAPAPEPRSAIDELLNPDAK